MMHKITPDLLPLATDIKSIKPDPANPREDHDVDGIAKSMNDYGQCETIVVNKRTKMIEAGHGRLYAAQKLGWDKIAVNFVDHDEQQAIGYNIAANLLSDKSRFNDEALLTLLQSLDEPLNVPGVDEDFMKELLENVGGDLMGGAGGVDGEGGIDKSLIPGEGRYKEQYGVIVVCGSDKEQEKVYEALTSQGYNCKVVVT